MQVPIWNSLSSRKRKLIGWTAGLVAFYAVLGFLILPPIVRSVAAKQLSKQLDREVSIQSVEINPFALSVIVRGLLIKDKDGEAFVSWDEVYVNFEIVSLFSKAWTFKEISTSKPHVRAVLNKDGTFNFTDIVTKFSTNSAPTEPKAESKPLVLHVGRLRIGGFTAQVEDFTTRTPFKRTLGPLDITLDDFRTDPDNKNPYAFSGTTDAGERIAWSGHFYLSPLRSAGELKLFNFTLNKYSALYQDFVRFDIRDGAVALDINYQLDFDPTNTVAVITNSAIGLRDFRLGATGDSNDIVALPAFSVADISADFQHRNATVGSIVADGATLNVARSKDAAINVVELSKPAPTTENAPGGILLLLQSVTNAVTLLLNSTNQWSGAIASVCITNCAVHLEDEVNSRPAKLDLTDIDFTAKNISNIPGTNLEAALSLRWNTNGSIKVATSASFLPPTADVRFDIDQLDLGTLDPYLEPKLDLYILGSKVGLHGDVHLRTPENSLPQVTFAGNASLDGFHTVDGKFGEDLVKWDTIRFNGIAANLNPPSVAIKQIVVDGAYVRFIVESNKTFNLLNALRLTHTNAPATNETEIATAAAARKGASPTGTTATNTAPLPPASIGSIDITNTVFRFTDRSLKPEVNLSIRDFGGSIAGLSTEQLQHADISLHAMVDGVGPVSINGTLNPFNETQTNTLKVSVKNVELTPVSPYAGKFAGYRIGEGKLNLDLDYVIVGKNLSSKNVITIDQFNFGEKVNSPDATHLPVRLAVAIMKDRDGKIVLDVPVEGRTDDPQFRVRKVVWRAIENILVKAATSPFSLLGAIFGGGGEELGYQDFAAGGSELTPDNIKKLETLQKMLFARPALRVEVSGSIDPDGDREGLQRVALDKQIRQQVWLGLSKSERATNSTKTIVVPPDIRASWVKRLYAEAITSGKINAQFIASHTNLAVLATQVATAPTRDEKGAQRLMRGNTSAKSSGNGVKPYQTKLVPLPTPEEAVLLATFPVADEDLEALASARARIVQAWLVASGKVDASRLFLKTATAEDLRQDGSRAYLQLQ